MSTVSFFHRKSPHSSPPCPQKDIADRPGIDTSRLTSDDPEVAAFYAQLGPRERIAHTIAIDKLGTSYDVTRTHAFTKWKKSQEQVKTPA